MLHAKWLSLYAEWFQRLKAVHPTLVWVNNLALEEAPFLPISNGRMFEGGAGLDVVYGGQSISSFVAEIRKWTTQSLQPSYVNVHMNGNMGGGLWRIGRWQNLVTGGEMMRLMTDFRRMRFGLGVALLTDGYYGYDVGSEMYGAPSYFTEYEADLGQAVDDPVLVHSDGGVSSTVGTSSPPASRPPTTPSCSPWPCGSWISRLSRACCRASARPRRGSLSSTTGLGLPGRSVSPGTRTGGSPRIVQACPGQLDPGVGPDRVPPGDL